MIECCHCRARELLDSCSERDWQNRHELEWQRIYKGTGSSGNARGLSSTIDGLGGALRETQTVDDVILKNHDGESEDEDDDLAEVEGAGHETGYQGHR